jgi:hypothetical protein
MLYESGGLRCIVQLLPLDPERKSVKPCIFMAVLADAFVRGLTRPALRIDKKGRSSKWGRQ